jgi:uncharacterized protein YgiM (DUF1202 family)
MRAPNLLKGLILILMALTLLSACETPAPYTGPPVVFYYVSPTMTFLRSCPSYGEECYVVETVYSGDRVELLERTDYGWSRVRLERTGAIGWMPSDLLSLSPLPPTYYVSMSSVYLRDCADYNCRARELLHRGDRVEKLDQDYRGWWRVVSLRTRNTGWVPAAALSPQPGPPYYYVDVSSLALRAGPSTGTRIITTLHLNDRVEMLGLGPTGWAQVRDLRTNIIGWVAARYLETFPVAYPRSVPRKRAPAQKAAPEESQPAPSEQPPKAPAPAPKAM